LGETFNFSQRIFAEVVETLLGFEKDRLGFLEVGLSFFRCVLNFSSFFVNLDFSEQKINVKGRKE
jgi:hypothetical protein